MMAKSKGCETISLEVRGSNTAAIDFYLKNEFYQVSIRKSYYRDPIEDAKLLMRGI